MATKDIKSQINVGIKLTVSKAESAQLTKAVKSAAQKAEAERTKVIKNENRQREREEERFQTKLSHARAQFFRQSKERELRITSEYRAKQEQVRFRPGPGTGVGQKAADMERGFREIERSRRQRGFDPGGQTLAEISAYESSGDRQSKAAAKAAQARARQLSREEDKEFRAAAKEREAAKRQEAADLRRAMKSDQRAERERSRRAAAAERESARAEVRRNRAEAQAAFAEGGADPRVAQMNAASPGSGDRWAAARAARGQGRQARAAEAATRSRRAAFSRGAHGLGAIGAGIASGSPIGGAFSGGYGGMLFASAVGLGGAGAAGLGILGGGLAALGATGVMGMRDATSAGQAALGTLRQNGQMLIDPANLGRAQGMSKFRFRFANALAGKIGSTQAAVLQAMSQASALSGGWDENNIGLGEEAARLQKGLGIDPRIVGTIERARRRGGLVGSSLIGPNWTSGMAGRAVGSGFQGSEINEFLGLQAGLMDRAAGLGTQFNDMAFGRSVDRMSPMLGQAQSSRVAGGLQNALFGVATQGIGGAPDPLTGIMLMQAAGLKIGSRGVSAKDIFNVQSDIERRGVTPGMIDSLRSQFRGMGGGSELGMMLGQNVMAKLGAPMGPGMMRSFMSGKASNADIAAMFTPFSTAGASAAGLAGGGGPAGYGEGVVPAEARAAAATDARMVEAGMKALPGAQALDASLSKLAKSMGDMASAFDDFKASMLSTFPGVRNP